MTTLDILPKITIASEMLGNEGDRGDEGVTRLQNLRA